MRVLGFGEILYDVFGDNEQIGGAAFNFLAHSARLGAEATLYSAVGNDARGNRAREYLRRYGVSDQLLISVGTPTGICQVTLDEQAVPTYHLVQPAAWDMIPWNEEICHVVREAEWDVVYFGSLCCRNDVSAESCRQLLDTISSHYRVFDCNIRPPFIFPDVLTRSLEKCTHFKVSREETGALADVGVVPIYDDAARNEWCKAVSDLYQIEQVLLTLDKDGAAVYDAPSDVYYERASEKVSVVSTVGAGDSFTAGYMASLVNGYSVSQALERAVKLAGQVVQYAGAIPEEVQY